MRPGELKKAGGILRRWGIEDDELIALLGVDLVQLFNGRIFE